MKLDELLPLLKQRIDSAKAEQRPLDHILLCGPRDLTLEALSYVSAQAQVRMSVFEAAAYHESGNLGVTLTHLSNGSILHIDEIHCLDKYNVLTLRTAMQDFVLPIVTGKGPQQKKVSLPLARFSVLATTTRPTLLPYELHTHFPVEYQISR